eukprot:9586964-Alexandrium_andersonii.AAC.1
MPVGAVMCATDGSFGGANGHPASPDVARLQRALMVGSDAHPRVYIIKQLRVQEGPNDAISVAGLKMRVREDPLANHAVCKRMGLAALLDLKGVVSFGGGHGTHVLVGVAEGE